MAKEPKKRKYDTTQTKKLSRERPNRCLCGCGLAVKNKYQPGHARAAQGKVWQAIDDKGTLHLKELPAVLRPFAKQFADDWDFEVKRVKKAA